MSVSDEALLLLENYLEKWNILAEEEVVDTGPMQNNNTTTKAETGSGQGKKKKARRMAGK